MESHKRTLYIKEVDRFHFDEKRKDCFGQTWSNEKDLITERLNKYFNIEYSNNPDLVIASLPIGNLKGTDYDKYRDKILVHIIGESIYPDFNTYDYAISSYHTLTLKDRYLYIPYSILCCDLTRRSYDLMRQKHVLNDEQKLVQRSFCSFVVSNGYYACPEREHFFYLLSEYKKVDSGGAFLNNIGSRVTDKLQFDGEHKFSIVFENRKDSFISEKIDMAFAAKTIPIYWGNREVTDLYNSKAFINCHDYNSFEEVIEIIKKIDNDDELYLKMLKEPALLIDRPKEYYIEKLDEFVIGIVEHGRIYRCNYGWSKRMQDVRVMGMRCIYFKRWIKDISIKTMRMVLYPIRKTNFILKIKDKVYRKW